MQSPEMETAAPSAKGNGGKGKSTPKSTLSGCTPQERWARANPQAVWAQAALRSGLKRGLVIQEACRVCGALETDAHHADYDRPLDVDWLCRKHHKAEHRRLKCEPVDG